MQIRDIEKLKVWLLKKLQPLCDADPAALSKYIVALLRKEKPRSALKELCINQLEVFLSKETPNFVEKLFRSLESESYITGSDDCDATPPGVVSGGSNRSSMESGRSIGGVVNSSSPSIVPERIVTDHRRQSEDIRHREVDDDDRDFRRAHYRQDSSPLYPAHLATDKNKIKKKIEVDPPRRSIRQRLGNREDERRRRRPRSRSRSRSSTPDRASSHSPSTTPTGELDERGRRKRVHGDAMGGVSGDLKPVAKRQRCKDYDERGMCLLGEQCPFDHGSDPLVITGIPPYPPPPPFQLPIPPPPPPHSIAKATAGTDGYNPEDPSLTAGTNPPSLPPSLLPQMPLRPAFPPSLSAIPGMPPLPPPPPPPMHSRLPNPAAMPSAFTPVTCQAPPIAPPISSASYHNRHSTTNSYTSGGGMGGVKHPSRPSDTVVLRKIPRDMNSVAKLSGYFERFGTVVNLQVRYENDPESAIVQFSSPTEAKAAHDCTEAVLNNRFIRVYYLKNSGVGMAASGGVHDSNRDHQQKHQPITHTQTSTFISNSSSHPPVSHTVNYTEQTHNVIATPTSVSSEPKPTHPVPLPTHHQHGRSQQRVSAAAAAATAKRLELQKKSQSLLESQIQQQKLLLSKLEKSGKSLPSEEREKVIETIKSLSSSINKLKESLSSVTKAASVKPHPLPKVPRGRPPSLPSPTTPPASLQQQADQLRTEARKLGILPPSAPPTNSKKDPPPKKPDPKSRQLLVVNVEDKDALIKYFESFGGLTQIERDADNSKNVIFTFKSRSIAEKAAKGSLFQGKPLIMKWYTPKPPPTSTTDTPSLTVTTISETTRVVTSNETTGHVTSGRVLLDENVDGKILRDAPTSLSLLDELQDLKDLEAELQEDQPIDVYTPEQSKPRVVHLLDDEEEELDERSWRH